MKRLFGSEIPILLVKFRDLVRAKYKVELTLQDYIDEMGFPLTGIFIEEDHPLLEDIKRELEIFMKDPFNERYNDVSWSNGNIEPTFSNEIWSKLPVFRISKEMGKRKFTVFITALCTLIFTLQLFGFDQEIFSLLHYPTENESQQYWRYISHALVHLSVWHFLFNLIWWWIFGSAIEKYCGSLKLIFLFFCTALVTGFSQNVVSGPAFFGLSGVVYGVLGYVFVRDKFSVQKVFDLPQGFFTMLWVGIVVGFIAPVIDIYMGNTAHIVGVLIGCLFAIFELKLNSRR